MQNVENRTNSKSASRNPSAHNASPAPGLKVSVGSGNVGMKGFIRVDIDPSTQPDHLMDARKLNFAPGSVDILYACHVLEHINFQDTGTSGRWNSIVSLLSSWQKCLSAQGCLYVCVPDLEKLAEILVKNDNLDIQKTILDVVYGGARNEYDFHISGFTKTLLTSLLLQSGFSRVETFIPFVADESSHVLLGESISLNLIAFKGESEGMPFLEKLQDEPKLDELQTYMRVADQRRQEILTLSKACDERLALIIKLQGELALEKAKLSPDFWIGRVKRKIRSLVKK